MPGFKKLFARGRSFRNSIKGKKSNNASRNAETEKAVPHSADCRCSNSNTICQATLLQNTQVLAEVDNPSVEVVVQEQQDADLKVDTQDVMDAGNKSNECVTQTHPISEHVWTHYLSNSGEWEENQDAISETESGSNVGESSEHSTTSETDLHSTASETDLSRTSSAEESSSVLESSSVDDTPQAAYTKFSRLDLSGVFALGDDATLCENMYANQCPATTCFESEGHRSDSDLPWREESDVLLVQDVWERLSSSDTSECQIPCEWASHDLPLQETVLDDSAMPKAEATTDFSQKNFWKTQNQIELSYANISDVTASDRPSARSLEDGPEWNVGSNGNVSDGPDDVFDTMFEQVTYEPIEIDEESLLKEDPDILFLGKYRLTQNKTDADDKSAVVHSTPWLVLEQTPKLELELCIGTEHVTFRKQDGQEIKIKSADGLKPNAAEKFIPRIVESQDAQVFAGPSQGSADKCDSLSEQEHQVATDTSQQDSGYENTSEQNQPHVSISIVQQHNQIPEEEEETYANVSDLEYQPGDSTSFSDDTDSLNLGKNTSLNTELEINGEQQLESLMTDVRNRRWDRVFTKLGVSVKSIDYPPSSQSTHKHDQSTQEVDLLLETLESDFWRTEYPLEHPCGLDCLPFSGEDVINSDLFPHIRFEFMHTTNGESRTPFDPDQMDDVVQEMLKDPSWPIVTAVMFLVHRKGLHGVGVKRALKMARANNDWRYITVVCRGLNIFHNGCSLDKDMLDVLGLEENVLLNRRNRISAIRYLISELSSLSMRSSVLDLVTRSLIVWARDSALDVDSPSCCSLKYIAALETMEDFNRGQHEMKSFFLTNFKLPNVRTCRLSPGHEVRDQVGSIIDYVLERKHLVFLRDYMVATNAFQGRRVKINFVAKQAVEEQNWPLFLRCMRYREVNVQDYVHGDTLLHIALRQPGFRLLRFHLQNIYCEALDQILSSRGYTLLQETVNLWCATGSQNAVDNALLLFKEGADPLLPYAENSDICALKKILYLAAQPGRTEQVLQLLKTYLAPADFWRGLSYTADPLQHLNHLSLLDVILLLPEPVFLDDKMEALLLWCSDSSLLHQHREIVQRRWDKSSSKDTLPLLYLMKTCRSKPEYLHFIELLQKAGAFLDVEKKLAWSEAKTNALHWTYTVADKELVDYITNNMG